MSIIKNAKASNDARFADGLYQAVKIMPIAIFRIPDKYEVPASLFTILHDHIYYVYSAYKASATPDPNLEYLLGGYPEYQYHMLSDQIGHGEVLSQSEENSVHAMFNNPFWAIKWLERHFVDDTYKEMLRHIYNLKDHDAWAAHCFHWLKTRTATPEVKTGGAGQGAERFWEPALHRYHHRAGVSGRCSGAVANRGAGFAHVVLQLAAADEKPRCEPQDDPDPAGMRTLVHPVHQRCKPSGRRQSSWSKSS